MSLAPCRDGNRNHPIPVKKLSEKALLHASFSGVGACEAREGAEGRGSELRRVEGIESCYIEEICAPSAPIALISGRV